MQCNAVDGAAGVKIEAHAFGADGQHFVLQPRPVGDVGHGLAEGCEEHLVVALIGRIAVDQIRRVVFRLPLRHVVNGFQADVGRTSDQHRRLQLPRKLDERGGEQVAWEETAFDQRPNRLRFKTEAGQHRLRPDDQIDVFPARDHFVVGLPCQVDEGADILDLALWLPGNLVVLVQIRLNHQKRRSRHGHVSLPEPPEPIPEVGAVNSQRHNSDNNQSSSRPLPRVDPRQVHHRSRDHCDKEAQEVGSEEVGGLSQNRPLNGGMSKNEPRVAVEQELASKALDPDPHHWHHHSHRPGAQLAVATDAPDDPYEQCRIQRQINTQQRISHRGHCDEPLIDPQPHRPLDHEHGEHGATRRAGIDRQPDQGNDRDERHRPESDSGKGRGEQDGMGDRQCHGFGHGVNAWGPTRRHPRPLTVIYRHSR